MKSLSILLLLATLSSLLIGALFAVTPTAAGSNTPTNPSQPETAQLSADQAETAISEQMPAEDLQLEVSDAETQSDETPVQDSNSPETSTETSEFDPGVVIATAFSTANLEKETIPETGMELESETVALAAAPVAALNLTSFAETVASGSANQITGIYAENTLALRVSQQPNGDAAYISNQPGEVTQFGLASAYGSLGLLGHNYLSGGEFYNLSQGQTITLVYGDGNTQTYQVQEIRSFQALSPNSVHSNFVDLDSGNTLSASDLFRLMYDQDDNLVLQTCITNEGISTWGRLFVVATPVN